MDMLVSKSTLKVHEARSLRRLLLTVTIGRFAMLGAGLPVPLYTPSLISTLTTIRAMGDRGDMMMVVPTLGLQLSKAISAMRRGGSYYLLKMISMWSTLEVV